MARRPGAAYDGGMQTTAASTRDTAGRTLGRLLREWRTTRGMSQLDLALRSGFSARHVSFIETRRTQPSRQALLALAEALEVPLRERNRLLEAAAAGAAHRDVLPRRRDVGARLAERHRLISNCLCYAARLFQEEQTCD